MIRRKPGKPKRHVVAARKRKRSKASWTRRLDDLCRALVFKRDKFECVMAGLGGLSCKGGIQWCHVDSRRFRSTRWLPENSFTGCAAHHFWWHDRPRAAIQWWENTYQERNWYLAGHDGIVARPEDTEADLLHQIREYEPNFEKKGGGA